MADEDVVYVDVQPVPDSPVAQSTGPVVPLGEIHKGLSVDAQPEEESDEDDAADEDAESKDDSKPEVKRATKQTGSTTTTAGKDSK